MGKLGTGENLKPTLKRRGGFRLTRVLGIFFLIILLVFSIAIFFHRMLLRAYAPIILNTLAEKFESDYDLDLAWDGYRIAGLNDFTITGIALSDIPTDSVLLTIDSIRMRTSLIALAIRGEDPVQAVTSLHLECPIVALGREEGQWNIEKLFKPKEREKIDFPGSLGITIHEGAVEWVEGEIANGVPLPSARIAGLHGTYQLGTNGDMGLKLEGRLSSHDVEPTPITIQGTYSYDRDLINLNVNADAIDLELLRTYVARHKISKLKGFANTEVSILIGPDTGSHGYSLLGHATLTDGTIVTEHTDIPIRDANGEFHFTHESVFTSGLTANVDGATITMRGRIADFNQDIPSIDVVIESGDLRAATIRRYGPDISGLPTLGTINTRAEISISSDGINATVSADSPSLTFKAFPYSLNDFYAWYVDDMIVVQQAEVEILGGTITADGIVDLSSEELQYDFHVTALDLPGEQLLPYILGSLSPDLIPIGPISADLTITGGDETPLTASGILTRIKSRFRHIPIYQISG